MVNGADVLVKAIKIFNPAGTPSFIIDVKFATQIATISKTNNATITNAATSFLSALNFNFN